MPDNCWRCGEPIENDAEDLAELYNVNYPEDDHILVHATCAEEMMEKTRNALSAQDKWELA